VNACPRRDPWPRLSDNLAPVRLLVFTAVGLILMMIAYAFSLGGTVAALIFLFVLFNAVLDRWAKPLVDWIKA
jgi:hypothetical protein